MTIALIGGTGRTGSQILAQSIDAGMAIRALARRPDALPAAPNLTKVKGDVTDANAIRELITPECNAVVSALGVVESKEPTTVFSDGMTLVIARMREVGITRLLAISASGFHIDRYDTILTHIAKPILKRVFKNSYADLARMETIIQGSGLAWTIFIPPQLVEGALTGTVRTAFGHNVSGGMKIKRSDLAYAMLRGLPDPTTHGQMVYLAN